MNMNRDERRPLIDGQDDETPENNNSQQHNSTYMVNCKVCRGSGKVPKEQENQLIALIPYSDKRLKPKRTWLWILITIGICIFVASIISFIIAPRDVTLANNQTYLNPYKITYIYDDDGFTLSFKEQFIIENLNFYSVKLNSIQIDINRNSRLITPKINYSSEIKFGPRTKQIIDVYVDYTLYQQNDPYVGLCVQNIISELFSLVTSSFQFSTIWTSNLEKRVDVMQYIVCKNITISNH